MILSLDPSSSIVGYAWFDRIGTLLHGGLVHPDLAQAPSFDRIRSLRRYMRSLMDELRPEVIVIEWTKGKVGKRHEGKGAGLAVYGAGVGAIAVECDIWLENHQPGGRLVPILENDWTRGKPKNDRTSVIEALYPAYNRADDPGGDLADAIGLGLYYFRKKIFN